MTLIKQTPLESHSLSVRERQILYLLADGKNNMDVSTLLGIKERTVRFHLNNILTKLGAQTKTHAVALAIRQNLIKADYSIDWEGRDRSKQVRE